MRVNFILNHAICMLGFVFLLSISEVSSIQCIECNSYRNPLNCYTWDGFSFITNCTEGSTCTKIVQYVYGEKRVIRQCSGDIAIDYLKCYTRVGRKKVKLNYCHCDTDLCNKAPSKQTQNLVIVAFLIVMTSLIKD